MDARRDEILRELRSVQDPDLHRDLVSLGFIQNLQIDGDHVSFTIVLTTPACPVRDTLKAQSEAAVRRLPWVQQVSIEMEASTRVGRGAGNNEQLIPNVKNVIAVASGKGGVGKSTTSVNVALALADTGAKVGLLDGDIYGPNIPLMMGLRSKPQLTSEGGKIIPIRSYGIRLMSIGFFLDDENPVIWRGPMVHGAIQQFLRDVDWGDLDYLVVDLPPGTGDAPLSLSQLIPLSGVVIVTTPQDVALQDVAKGMSMFRRLEVPVIGVVENMSYFVCPNCDDRHEIFGKGGGERIAAQFGAPFLGKVPLQPRVREGGDEGRPVVVTAPDSIEAAAFREVAGAIARQVSILAYAGQGAFVPAMTIVKK
ncbi:MAG: Mrp/NBP35 family ATP-binding protein [Chloroflexi bacterium]|nr:Mrp/NBP35 family ATP-binding protein [Chloroflexota bacterium]